jgi:putative hemin transport protein
MDTMTSTAGATTSANGATTSASSQISEWIARRDQLMAENPKARARNVAADLGISEAQLVALDLGNGVTRLGTDWVEMLRSIESMGEVMALTRNEHCVHEKHGVYRNFEQEGNSPVVIFVDEKIDLRIFLMGWAFGFAVDTPIPGKAGEVRRSIQFFNRHGDAVHKIYMTKESHLDAYHAFVDRFRADSQEALLEVSTERRPTPPEKPDAEVDRDAFLKTWSEMKDTHEFFGFIRQAGVSRTQALRLAEGVFTRPVSKGAARDMLMKAAETETPIMVFVGNPGCIQIHSGTVKKLFEQGPWYNVMDPDFNLHLNETAIDRAWVVRKPSVDGDVNSLEVFDKEGELIVQFFGKRKPGIPELQSWRDVAASLN